MTTIHQTGESGNPTDEPGGETAGEERDASDTIDEGAQRVEGGGAIGAGAESDAATEESDQPPPPLMTIAGDRPRESVTASVAHGLTALALLRAYLEERGLSKPLEGALSTLDAALRHPRAERTAEGVDSAPTSIELGKDDDEDEEPPTSRILPPPLSTLAIRLNERTMLVSLEDAEGCDLSGREIVRCLVLTSKEAERALKIADAGLADAAASILGSLPKGAS